MTVCEVSIRGYKISSKLIGMNGNSPEFIYKYSTDKGETPWCPIQSDARWFMKNKCFI